VGASVGERRKVQTRGGNRVSTISLLGCSTSVALTTGPTDEEEEECASVGHGRWRRPPDMEHIKLISFKAWTEPYRSRRPGVPEFLDYHHMKVVGLSAVRTDRLYQPADITGTHFCYRLIRTQGHSAVRRIMSMKNYYTQFRRSTFSSICIIQPKRSR